VDAAAQSWTEGPPYARKTGRSRREALSLSPEELEGHERDRAGREEQSSGDGTGVAHTLGSTG